MRAVVPDSPPVRILVDGAEVDGLRGRQRAGRGARRRAMRCAGTNSAARPRAGFCLMGACQDCWVWLADGARVRACTTPVADGMHVLTQAPPGFATERSRSSAPVRPALRPRDVLAAHGVAPVVIDEGREPGGQIYRQPRPGLQLDIEGSARRRGRELPATSMRRSTRLRDRIDYRPQTLAWGVDDAAPPHACAARGRYGRLRRADPCDRRDGPRAADAGLDPAWRVHARRRAGAAQGAWLPDRAARRVLRQSSPLLYLAAKQYRADGRRDRRRARHDAVRGEARGRTRPADGAAARSRAASVHGCRCGAPASRCITASTLRAFEGVASVEAVRFVDAAATRARFACDAVAFGFGLKPETQLAELAGVAARLRSGVPPMAAARRRRRRAAAAASISRATARHRRRAGRGAHRRARGLRRARRLTRSRSLAWPCGVRRQVARLRALPARPRARLRVAGRGDPRAR